MKIKLRSNDGQGTLLETVIYIGSSTPQGLVGFAGVQEASNIGRLDVSYHPNFDPAKSYNFSMDNLGFAEVPEPSTACLAGIAFLGGYCIGRGRPTEPFAR